VKAGEPPVDGPRNPHDILDVLGEKELQKHLVNEIQEVYRLQGVNINDKHLETIVRQMMRWVGFARILQLVPRCPRFREHADGHESPICGWESSYPLTPKGSLAFPKVERSLHGGRRPGGARVHRRPVAMCTCESTFKGEYV
jgi:hypothetical protein